MECLKNLPFGTRGLQMLRFVVEPIREQCRCLRLSHWKLPQGQACYLINEVYGFISAFFVQVWSKTLTWHCRGRQRKINKAQGPSPHRNLSQRLINQCLCLLGEATLVALLGRLLQSSQIFEMHANLLLISCQAFWLKKLYYILLGY